MELKNLVSEPQLIKITIDEDHIVKKYGETLDFYIYDRQDMDTFMKLANMSKNKKDDSESEHDLGAEDITNVFDMVKELIYDENGERLLTENQYLPPELMLLCVEKTMANLGNLVTQTSVK